MARCRTVAGPYRSTSSSSKAASTKHGCGGATTTQASTFNGWYIPVETSTFSTPWNTYTVTFDTTWSDATAVAKGWMQEPTSAPFASLWDDIYTAEVRIVGTGGMEAGIDNYSIQPAPVPLPAGFVLMATALAGFAAARRR